MYLPRKEEVKAIAEQNKTLIIACILLLIIAAAGSWLVCRHYDKQSVRENRNVERTVQSITDDNKRARDNISKVQCYLRLWRSLQPAAGRLAVHEYGPDRRLER